MSTKVTRSSERVIHGREDTPKEEKTSIPLYKSRSGIDNNNIILYPRNTVFTKKDGRSFNDSRERKGFMAKVNLRGEIGILSPVLKKYLREVSPSLRDLSRVVQNHRLVVVTVHRGERSFIAAILSHIFPNHLLTDTSLCNAVKSPLLVLEGKRVPLPDQGYVAAVNTRGLLQSLIILTTEDPEELARREVWTSPFAELPRGSTSLEDFALPSGLPLLEDLFRAYVGILDPTRNIEVEAVRQAAISLHELPDRALHPRDVRMLAATSLDLFRKFNPSPGKDPLTMNYVVGGARKLGTARQPKITRRSEKDRVSIPELRKDLLLT